jgi:nicotinate phosphoribosyltransferase
VNYTYYDYNIFFLIRKSGRQNNISAFDLFFRKNPFRGEFTIFAGLSQILKFMETFKVTVEHINFLKQILPNADPEFFIWFKEELKLKDVIVYAPIEGTVVFPREPLLRVEGPLAACQLLETVLLNLVNFPSLVCTNAARYRLLCGPNKQLLEFGLRRAQGPDGAMSASVYSFMGGFDGTSNVLASLTSGIPIYGTHAHAFITSFSGLSDLEQHADEPLGNSSVPFREVCMRNRQALSCEYTNDGELAAFISYALCFPQTFLCLVDTYSTEESGIPNFLVVSLSLVQCGLRPVGVRLDSGDLAYLSKFARTKFKELDEKVGIILDDFKFENLKIVASNDLNETTLSSLELQGHAIDCFGIGTNLVTCQSQPALGCVYKMVEIEGSPRIKLSQEIEKVTIPGRKKCYRLFGKERVPLLDLMVHVSEDEPKAGHRVLCRHPFIENKRAFVSPALVTPLHVCVWKDGQVTSESGRERTLYEIRQYVQEQLKYFREDILRPVNPTPYKVSLSDDLFTSLHSLWMAASPIADLC